MPINWFFNVFCLLQVEDIFITRSGIDGQIIVKLISVLQCAESVCNVLL